jgi:hypothetical protein
MREFRFTCFTFFSNLLGETFPDTVTICLSKSHETSSTPAAQQQQLAASKASNQHLNNKKLS